MDRVTQLRNELYINGFAVMEDAIPMATIDRIHASFLPLLEHVRDRDHDSVSRSAATSASAAGTCSTPTATRCIGRGKADWPAGRSPRTPPCSPFWRRTGRLTTSW